MSGPLALGVNADDGTFPEALTDLDAMWDYCTAASASVVDKTLLRSCKRPAPPENPSSGPHLGVTGLDGEEMDDLSLTGWAILYGAKTSQAIKDKLKPLIDYRESKVGQGSSLFQVFDGDNHGYQAGWKVADWIGSFKKVSLSNQVKPQNGVPFYLLIVAAPDDISFEFQYLLDVYWGVGRLWLQNDEDYAAYVRAVIANEEAVKSTATPELAFFAPRFAQDNGATRMVCDLLVDRLRDDGFAARRSFAVTKVTSPEAKKQALIDLYSGKSKRPALCFVGSHGLLVNHAQTDFLKIAMGAILTEDWNGKTAPVKTHFVAARDILADSDLSGTIHILCACYGAGWPQTSTYDGKTVSDAGPGVARLPQAILAKGGLAVLGHIDRAWSYSYVSEDGTEDRTQEYQDVLELLMKGARAGHATDRFNYHWKVLGDEIAELQKTSDTQTLHDRWIERDDARNYVLLGDPAVKLRVDLMKAAARQANAPGTQPGPTPAAPGSVPAG